MKISAVFSRPEYVFRPLQIARRLVWRQKWAAGESHVWLNLPWGLPLRVATSDAMGQVMLRTGIYDLHVCEVIARLLDPGETAVDVGANMGEMCSLLAACAGPRGRVLAFEPHPVLFAELESNCAAWQTRGNVAALELRQQAVSDAAGVARLFVPRGFAENRGVCTLAIEAAGSQAEVVDVAAVRLDDVLAGAAFVGLMKIDVEGFELGVLQGALGTLRSRRVRDILFEENRQTPTPVTELLTELGYRIFHVDGGLWGLKLRPMEEAAHQAEWGPQNYVATLDVERLQRRVALGGWRSLGKIAVA